MRGLKKIASTEFLLLCGVIGPLLFIVVLLIEGATRPGYSAWRNYGSDLELSNQGWEQIANFIVCGLLCIAFAAGLRRIWRTGRASVWGPLLIGLFGLGLVAAGVFVTDPGRGYPPGAPLKGDPQTRSWATYSWITGAFILLVVVLSNVSAPIAENGGFPLPLGLIQRAQIIPGWIWLALVALHLWRQERKAMSREASARITVTEANVG